MSKRVMDTLLTVSPHVVPYSIDEAFVHLPTGGRTGDALREHVEATAREIRRRVLRWTGIPVRVSVAETKTLAKAASKYARTLLKARRREGPRGRRGGGRKSGSRGCACGDRGR